MKERFEDLVAELAAKGFFLEEVVELVEKTLIQKTLGRTGGNRLAAAKALGIHRNTLQRKMSEYHLEPRKPARPETRTRKKAASA